VNVVYLSLGSNLGDRFGTLQLAVDTLHRPDLLIARTSAVYETAPVDLKEQPDFLNIVVEAQTSLLPLRLLQRTQKIEREMGRKRTVPKGPRTLDIDILVYGPFVVNTANLQIPHPRMQDRRFVLEPLAELARELRHPVTRVSVREILAAAPNQLVRRTPLVIDLSRTGAEKRT
jgi:2-amino-4-hydroxy-6-hydroxymethyldihydropteridine diphosphokinase